MRTLKPQRLRAGDVIGICAPAGAISSLEKLNRGVRYLEQLGFRVEIGQNVTRKNGYLAGSDMQRAADLNSLFSQPRVKAIFAARGGYGSHRILPLLNYALIKRNPKIVVGYSDITAIHCALLAKANLLSFSGPMVAVEMFEGISGNIEELFWRCLMSAKPLPPIQSKIRADLHRGKRSSATGRLLGGNLSLIAALVGTPYLPQLTNPIFLFEEIDERPYRIDRMLQQMKLSETFRHTRGIALGEFTGCAPEKGKPSLTLRQILADTFRNARYPIVSGFSFGHNKNSVSFPVGVKVCLDGPSNKLTFLESALS